jgi:hypothetical protein
MQNCGYTILAMAFGRGRQLGSVGMNRLWDALLELADLTVMAMRRTAAPPPKLCSQCTASEDPYIGQGRTWRTRRCNQLEGRLHCLGREVLETSTILRAELERQLKTLKFTQLGCMRG